MKSPLTHRSALACAALAACMAIMPACMSLSGRARLFAKSDLENPSEKTLANLICMDQDEGASLYLHGPSFDWMSEAAKEGYMVGAKMVRYRGGCPCPGKTCAERASEASAK